MKKKKKKSESTGLTHQIRLTRQTWDLCHEIGKKKVDAFQLQLITIFKDEIGRKKPKKKKKKKLNQLS